MKRKILFIVGVVVLLVVIGVLALFLNLSSVVKKGIETMAPKILGVPVTLESFSLSPMSGKIEIDGFIVGNPAGYTDGYAFKLEKMMIEVVPSSLFSDKIHVKKVLIEGADFKFETKFTESNISVIKGNIDKFSKKKEEGAGTETPADKKTAKPKKFIIDEFVMSNNTVGLKANLLGQGVGSDIPLPNIKMENIGKDENGVTIGKIVCKIFDEISAAIIEAVSDVAGGINTNKIEKKLDSVIDDIKKLF